jgi:protein-S-isoprenylcysteine O-methyltransferase Ste14
MNAAGRIAASLARVGSVVLVGGLFALLFVSCVKAFMATGELNRLGLAVVNAVFVCLYVSRKDATALSTAPLTWAVSLGGTLLPLLMRPSGAEGFVLLGDAIQWVGIVVIIVAVLSLWRSFGIVPANRGIRQTGLYRVVRHPLYAGEMLFLTGVVVAHPSLSNVVVWAADCALQLWRAKLQERFLSEDPVYRSYCQRTRYRLLPLLY